MTEQPLWLLRFYIEGQDIEPLFDMFDAWALSFSVFEEIERVSWWGEALFDALPDQEALTNKLVTFGASYQLTISRFNLQKLESTDWLAKNRQDFPELQIGRFHIYRQHHTPPVATRGDTLSVPICLEAGIAFGSGTHESTQGCLQALDHLGTFLKPQRMLDLGCGSGILAIAMAKLWHCQVVAIDNDPDAVRITQQNAVDNNIPALIEAMCAEGVSKVNFPEGFDCVTANILAQPLIHLAPQICDVTNEGGYIVLAGLTVEQQTTVAEAYLEHNVTLHHTFTLDSWVTLVFCKKG